MKKKMWIEGMSCEHCVHHTEEALKEINGVNDVTVSLEDKSAVVEVDNVSNEILKEAVTDAGYEVSRIEDSE